ncbi:MAG: IS1595 family transposase [Reyranellaceae bacterium]
MARSVFDAPHFQNETAAFEYVEAHLWPNGPVCPHCGNVDQSRIGRLQGKTTRPGLRKCYACRKPFTVRQGSIFEDSHLALHLWLQVIHLMSASKKGISTRQIQRMLSCSMKTAWFLTHRIRAAMAPVAKGRPPMGGLGSIVEADETFFGAKAGRKLHRAPVEKQVVFALVERGGEARAFHLSRLNATQVRSKLGENVKGRSTLMSDESGLYTHVGWNFARHDVVNHSAQEYVRGDAYTNSVEGFFGIMKRGIYGTYQAVSPWHLQRYVDEFAFRYTHREKVGVDDTERASRALRGAKGKRMTYQTVVWA